MPRGGRGRIVRRRYNPYGQVSRYVTNYAKLKYPRLSYAASWAYNNRGALNTGYGYAKRAYSGLKSYTAKRATKAKKRKVGQRVGTSNTKQTELVKTTEDIDTRTLYRINMLVIGKASTGERRDNRIRDVVNFRGWKVCFTLRNKTQEPIRFHWAVIQPKRPVEFEQDINADFFRSVGTQNRAVDFSSSLNALEFECNPINTDKFLVIHHKKFELAPVNNATGAVVNNMFNNGNGRNWYTFNKYIPLKRQIRYGDDGAPESGLYFVYWCDQFQNTTGQVVQPDVVTKQMRITSYFKETATF